MNDIKNLVVRYNRVLAENESLKETIKDKKKHSERREAEFKKVDDLARSLCQSILAKMPQEMILSKEYSWAKVSTNELLFKAITAFTDYCIMRTELMQRLAHECEERRIKCEALEEALKSRVIDSCNDDGDLSSLSSEEIVEAKNAEMKKNDAFSKTSQATSEAEEKGLIEGFTEEDEDVSIHDLAELQEHMDMSRVGEVKTKKFPIHPSKKRKDAIEKDNKARREVEIIDLADVKKHMSGYAWIFVEAIGLHGESEYLKIANKALEIWDDSEYKKENDEKGKNSVVTIRRFESVKNILKSCGVILEEGISDSVRPRFSLCSLTHLGVRLFKSKYGRPPVISERDMVIANHDNVEHGYGILAVCNILEESGVFKKISQVNKGKGIKLKNGTKYEPDIVAFDGNKKHYFEYERGFHIQSDFNAKLNKMTEVTNVVNLVVPNADTLKRVKSQVDAWIAHRGGIKVLSTKKVRIATSKFLIGKNPTSSKSWQVLFDMKSEKALF